MAGSTQTAFARAKVNLALHVLAREQTGFHQIETVFCALELADEIEVSVAGDVISLEVVAPPDAHGAPPDLGPAEANLACRAAVLFAQSVGTPGAGTGVHIRLVKRIPHGAGLGGGSSDAAAVLHALNHLHDRPLSPQELLDVGARLGSDVPFFLTGAPLALAWGRGGRLLPWSPLPSAPVLLLVPPERVPTGDAYAALSHSRDEHAEQTGADSTRPNARGAADAGMAARVITPPPDWAAAAAMAHNDFEDVVFQRLPLARALRDALEGAGARLARLTGTGSVVFGVFDDVPAADRAAESIAARFGDTRAIRTRTLDGADTPGGGFEPPLADPKSAVLPLDDPGSTP